MTSGVKFRFTRAVLSAGEGCNGKILLIGFVQGHVFTGVALFYLATL
jgi:hypothetical protein